MACLIPFNIDLAQQLRRSFCAYFGSVLGANDISLRNYLNNKHLQKLGTCVIAYF